MNLIRDLLNFFGSLNQLDLLSIAEICRIPGIASAKAT